MKVFSKRIPSKSIERIEKLGDYEKPAFKVLLIAI